MRLLLALLYISLTCFPSPVAAAERSAVDDLLQQLGSADRDERRNAAYRLAERGKDAAPAAVALGKAIHDRDPQVWAAATQALASIGPAAEPALKDLLRRIDMDNGQRLYRNAHALGQIGAAAMPALQERLTKRRASECRGALIAVGFMGENAADAAPQLVRLLAHDDEEIRDLAIEGLAVIGRPAILHLATTLETESPRVKAGATKALASIGPDAVSALDKLIALTRDKIPTLRAASVTAIGSIAPASDEVFAPMLAAMQDESPLVQKAAAASWIRAAPRLQVRAAPELARLLGEGGTVATNAALALSGFGTHAAAVKSAVLEQFLTRPDSPELARTLGRIGEPALPMLMLAMERGQLSAEHVALVLREMPAALRVGFAEELHHPSPRVRAAAALNIANTVVNRADAVNALTGALDDVDKDVRIAAARSLEAIGLSASSANQRLILLLTTDPVDDVRAAAVRSLSHMVSDHDTLCGAFTTALADASYLVRNEAILRLSHFQKVPVAFQRKLEDAMQNNADPAVRAASITAIVRIEESREITAHALVKALDDSQTHIQQEALLAISQLGEAAKVAVDGVSRLLSREDPIVRMRAIESLSAIGPLASSAFDEVSMLADDPDTDVRSAVVRAARHMGTEAQAVSLLIDRLVDNDVQVRHEAAEELARLQIYAAPAVPALLKMLSRKEDAEAARKALRRITIADEKAVPALIEIVEDDSWGQSARMYALHYLRKLGPKAAAALPMLRKRRDSAGRQSKQQFERAISEIEK